MTPREARKLLADHIAQEALAKRKRYEASLAIQEADAQLKLLREKRANLVLLTRNLLPREEVAEILAVHVTTVHKDLATKLRENGMGARL